MFLNISLHLSDKISLVCAIAQIQPVVIEISDINLRIRCSVRRCNLLQVCIVKLQCDNLRHLGDINLLNGRTGGNQRSNLCITTDINSLHLHTIQIEICQRRITGEVQRPQLFQFTQHAGLYLF